MNTRWPVGWLMVALLLLGPAAVWAQHLGDVDVEVVDDRGRPFPRYPVSDHGHAVYKAYLEATRGQNYAVQIRNRTDQRIGVVIAVDGRNIITGNRSNLRPDERMYVLGPNQQESYEGWRTGKNRVNRFYFTDEGGSYASAWGDSSAMGVIAVAVFRDSRPTPPWSQESPGFGDPRGLRSGPLPEAAPRRQAEPGTGYGEREWSPSHRVAFDAERRPFIRLFLKYAWRDTLCRQGVIVCGDGDSRPPRSNRFWNEEDRYAPPPPRPDYDNGENWR